MTIVKQASRWNAGLYGTVAAMEDGSSSGGWECVGSSRKVDAALGRGDAAPVRLPPVW